MHLQTVVVGADVKGRALSGQYVRNVCVKATASAAQGFSNDRVDFWMLAPVITHDPFVLRFARCTNPWESRQPRVSLSELFFHQI